MRNKSLGNGTRVELTSLRFAAAPSGPLTSNNTFGGALPQFYIESVAHTGDGPGLVSLNAIREDEIDENNVDGECFLRIL